jgi:phosphate regulon transcriptional regulator PhoB
MKVLVVDDEQPIVDAVVYNLRKEGYETLSAGDAEQCIDLFQKHSPDLIILDVMMPSASGFDVCRQLRRTSDVPIIMLTARAEETDRVVGLEIGADDYVTKPFSMRELIARVNSVLRRSSATQTQAAVQRIEAGDLVIDPGKHEVELGGKPLALSPREFDMLRFLASHPGQAFTRQTLLDRVWGADAYVVDRTVDVHIRWLREKIERDPSQPERILTVRGVGYKFAGEPTR